MKHHFEHRRLHLLLRNLKNSLYISLLSFICSQWSAWKFENNIISEKLQTKHVTILLCGFWIPYSTTNRENKCQITWITTRYLRRLERKAYLPPTANTAMQATTVSRGNNRARRGLVSWLLATIVTNMIEVLYILNKTDKSNITTLLKAFETPWGQVWIFCLCYKSTMKLSTVSRKCYLLNVLMDFAFSFQIDYISSGSLFFVKHSREERKQPTHTRLL